MTNETHTNTSSCNNSSVVAPQSLQEIISSFAYKPNKEEDSTPPQTPPPLIQKKKKKKTIKEDPSTSSNSSFLATNVGGKPLIVSRFFPIPHDASYTPIPIRRKKIAKKKLKFSKDGDEKKSMSLEEKKKNERKIKRSPYLSVSEKRSECYRRVSDGCLWDPPSSCHNLLQERHSCDPWRVLVICMLLNVTTGKQVKGILPGLFLLCPDAESATKVPVEEIEKVIQPLGLQKKRARMIKQFSCEYLSDDWTYVTQLHGIGKYAADAYAIFCAGRPEAVVPQDHKLLDYWKLLCNQNDVK